MRETLTTRICDPAPVSPGLFDRRRRTANPFIAYCRAPPPLVICAAPEERANPQINSSRHRYQHFEQKTNRPVLGCSRKEAYHLSEAVICSMACAPKKSNNALRGYRCGSQPTSLLGLWRCAQNPIYHAATPLQRAAALNRTTYQYPTHDFDGEAGWQRYLC